MFSIFKTAAPPPPPADRPGGPSGVVDALAKNAGLGAPKLMALATPPKQSCDVSASDHLYFAVRSVCANGRQLVMQYAFADDRGNVVLSAFVRSSSPATMVGGFASEDLAVEPMEEGEFSGLLARLCRGASLVAFHRVLQTGMLPESVLGLVAGSECVWRRFQAVARRKGIRLSRHEPLALNDCLQKLGLAPLETEDAAMRALAIRSLWRTLDSIDLD